MEGYTAPKPKVVPPEDMGVALPEIEVSGKASEPPTFPVVEGVPGLGQTAEAVLA